MKYKNKYPKPQAATVDFLSQCKSFPIFPATFYPHSELDAEEQLEPVLICMTCWAEARGECDPGIKAVAQVIMNRFYRQEVMWGFTVRQVLLDHNQNDIYEFSCMNPRDPNYSKMKKPDPSSWYRVCKLVLPIYFATPAKGEQLAYFYCNIMEEPSEFHKKLKPLFLIGNHSFYTDL